MKQSDTTESFKAADVADGDRKRNLRTGTKSNLVSIVVTIIVLVALGAYAWYNREAFAALLQVRWDYVVLLALLWIPFRAVPGLRIRAFLDHYGVQLRFTEWYGLPVITETAHLLMPFQTGAIPSAVYLKKEYRLAYLGYVSILVGGYVLFFLATSTLGLAVSGIYFLAYGDVPLIVLGFFTVILVGTLVVLALSPTIPRTQVRVLDYVGTVLEGWNKIRGDGYLVRTITALFILGSLTGGFRLFVAYKALSLDVDFIPVLLLSVVSQYAIFVKLTPGNLGIREALIAFSSEVVGIGFDEGLAAALVLRGTNLLMLLVMGPAFSYLLTRRMTIPEDDG